MKKMFLSMIAVGGMLTASAQYFQHTYGTPAMEYPRSGQNVRMNTVGHVMAGASDWLCSPQDMTLTRTDQNGNIAGPQGFNNIYRLVASTGANVSSQATRVIELGNGDLFVVGNFINNWTGKPGIFAARFNAAGVMQAIESFQTNPTASFIELNSVRQSIFNPNLVFATGSANYTNAAGVTTTGVIIMRLNTLDCKINGWANIYNFNAAILPTTFGQDIIESPYNPFGIQEVCVVGRTRMAAGNDGYFLEVSSAAGAPTAPGGVGQVFSTNFDDQFWGIDISNNPLGGAGFVIVGYTNGFNAGGVNYNVWTLKVNPAANAVVWQTTHDYSLGGRNDFAYDIIERRNTLGAWEYYTSGFTDNGSLGGNDAVVIKLNAGGFGVGEYTYGAQGTDRAFEIDQFPVGGVNPAPGLATFGMTNSFPNFPKQAADDIYLVKSYFNGESGCYQRFALPMSFGQQLPPVRIRFNRIIPFAQDTMRNPGVVYMNDTTLCYNVVIGTGNNTRQAQQPSLVPGNSINAYPNPIDANSGTVNLDYQSPADATIEIRLMDMMGREISKRSMSVVAGTQTLTVDFGPGMATGIYQIEVNNNGETVTARVAVK